MVLNHGGTLLSGRRGDLAAVVHHCRSRGVLDRAGGDAARDVLGHGDDRVVRLRHGGGLEARRRLGLQAGRVADLAGRRPVGVAVVDVRYPDVPVDDRRVRFPRVADMPVRVVQVAARVGADQHVVQDQRRERIDVAREDACTDQRVDPASHQGEHRVVGEAVAGPVVGHVAGLVDDADLLGPVDRLLDDCLVALVGHELLQLGRVRRVGLREAGSFRDGVVGARAAGRQAEQQGEHREQRGQSGSKEFHFSPKGVECCCLLASNQSMKYHETVACQKCRYI